MKKKSKRGSIQGDLSRCNLLYTAYKSNHVILIYCTLPIPLAEGGEIEMFKILFSTFRSLPLMNIYCLRQNIEYLMSYNLQKIRYRGGGDKKKL